MPENPRRLVFGANPHDPSEVILYDERGNLAARGYLKIEYPPSRVGWGVPVTFVPESVAKPAVDARATRSEPAPDLSPLGPEYDAGEDEGR